MKSIAAVLLAGILINFGCEFYSSYEQTDLVKVDIHLIKISPSTAPASSLVLFNRQPTEEENESSHRCVPPLPDLYDLIYTHFIAINLGLHGAVSSNTGSPESGTRADIIILQHRFLI